MNDTILYCAGNTSAMAFAVDALHRQNISVVSAPAPDVTHLLLPIPSFEADGRIRGGGILEHILAKLPEHVCIVGGHLDHAALKGYPKIDLLHDSEYLAKNAAITADCAIRIAANRLPVAFQGCPILILGWGRIGKCLANLLKALGAEVTVAARKPGDQAILRALGFGAADPNKLEPILRRFRVLFNTIPYPILSETQVFHCRPDCIKIELASIRGIAGSQVIPANGLPGKTVPETSGTLIADSIIRILSNKEAVS
ncbi:MAG: hypothetical protein J6Q30_06510 [Oscillospiraceae bacterium]|nr:hypothetical protein [Oscillospiraceae bacterium]